MKAVMSGSVWLFWSLLYKNKVLIHALLFTKIVELKKTCFEIIK